MFTARTDDRCCSEDVALRRPFAILGFNCERGVAEMLENLCHRTEETMSRIYGEWRAEQLNHSSTRFGASQAQSGSAGVGSCRGRQERYISTRPTAVARSPSSCAI